MPPRNKPGGVAEHYLRKLEAWMRDNRATLPVGLAGEILRELRNCYRMAQVHMRERAAKEARVQGYPLVATRIEGLRITGGQ